VRHLGFAAKVALLPDPSRPDLLAEAGWGWHAPPTPHEELLYRSITRRRTHRGPFTGDLVRIARKEQAELHIIYDQGGPARSPS